MKFVLIINLYFLHAISTQICKCIQNYLFTVVQTIENHFYQTRSYPGFISLQSALSRSREGTELNTLEKKLDTYRFASLAVPSEDCLK